MKRLLLPLLAALALPTAVNAESYWLLVEIDISGGVERLKRLKWKVWLNVISKQVYGWIAIISNMRKNIMVMSVWQVNKSSADMK